MNYPKNIKRSKRLNNSDFIIERSMQQSWERFWLFLKNFNTYQAAFFNKRTVPYCCTFDLSTSTKHCVVQGSGQDRELEVEQNIRIATEQKGQTYTKLGFLFSKFGSGSKCSLQPFVSFLKPNFSSESLWAEINTKQNNP